MKKCPVCKQLYDDKDTYCEDCGVVCQQIEKKTLRNRLLTIFLIGIAFLCFILLGYIIWGKICDDRLRFGISLILGIFSGSCIVILFKSCFSDKKITGIGLLNCFSIILTLFSLFLSIKPEAFYQYFQSDEITSLYNNSFNIDENFNDANEDKHHVIFAFDKTTYEKKGSKIQEQLQEKYSVYVNRFKNVYTVTDVKDISYREFCRAMLCAKLYTLNKRNVQGKFSIYLIEKESKLKFEGDISEEEDISNAIIGLYNLRFHDDSFTDTDFLNFYEKLDAKIKEEDVFNQHEFTKYVLYVYSDFVHDKQYRSVNDFDDHIKEIKEIQKKVKEKSIIQNLYIIPHTVKKGKNKREYILDTNIIQPLYTNIYFLEKNEPPQRHEHNCSYHKIKYSNRRLPIFHSNYDEGHSPNLSFSNSSVKYFIRIEEIPKTSKPPTIYLKTDKKEEIINENFSQITGNKISIVYRGHISKDSPIYLNIVKGNGIHCLFKLDFRELFPVFLKWLLPLSCFISGVWIAIFIGWIIIRRYTYKNIVSH